MQIKAKKAKKYVRFDSLSEGDVFRLHPYGGILIKINKIKPAEGDCITAITLDCAALLDIHGDDLVIPVSGQFVED